MDALNDYLGDQVQPEELNYLVRWVKQYGWPPRVGGEGGLNPQSTPLGELIKTGRAAISEADGARLHCACRADANAVLHRQQFPEGIPGAMRPIARCVLLEPRAGLGYGRGTDPLADDGKPVAPETRFVKVFSWMMRAAIVARLVGSGGNDPGQSTAGRRRRQRRVIYRVSYGERASTGSSCRGCWPGSLQAQVNLGNNDAVAVAARKRRPRGAGSSGLRLPPAMMLRGGSEDLYGESYGHIADSNLSRLERSCTILMIIPTLWRLLFLLNAIPFGCMKQLRIRS